MKTAIESAKATFDKLKAVVLRARQRAGAKTTAAVLPYSQWADLPRRKAAPVAWVRQGIRRAQFQLALRETNMAYQREPRRARRNIARTKAKAWWAARLIPA